ncbi:DNA-directed RNA polymerase I subunit RPA2, partial [Enteropsectra breve]
MKSNEIGDLHIGQFDLIFDEGILANVVANTKPLEYQGFRLIFEHLEIHMPYSKSNDTHSADKRLLPATCREQSLTYGGSCFIKVKLMYKKRVLLHEYKPAGVFPIMLKSKMCHLAKNSEASLYALGEDPRECGGYFIVGGYDKLVRFHIAYKRNHMFVLKNKSKDSAYSDYSCMIRSVGSDEIGQKNEIKYCADGNIHFKVYLRKRIYLIPVILILRALANTTDDEIYRSLGSDKRILQMLTMNKAYDAFSKREALVYLGTRFQTILRIEDPLAAGKEFVRMAILVHLEKFEDKYALIIDSIKKLLRCVGGEILPDDIDLTANHELYTEAQLIPLCVREKLEEIKKTFQTKILAAVRTRISTGDSTTSLNHSEIMELSDDFSEEQITKILKIFNNLDFGIGAKVNRFLSMGVVTTNSCSDLLQTAGFTILAERINYWRFASHFQSVSRGAFFSNLKITTVRKLRPESWGFLCPIHTPDGSPCGLLLHLSKSCHLVSRTAPIDPSVFYDFGLVPLSRGFNPHVPLYFNGRLLGTAADAPALVEKLRSF